MFDSREVEAMGDEELIDALRRAHGAAAFAQAAEITAVREVYRRHRAGNAAPGAGGVRAGEFAAAEIAVAVHVSEGVAAALIDVGLALDSLPGTKLAFAAGRIDPSRVQVIADCLRGLPREVRESLEPKLIDAALRSDPARLRQTAQRWVARLDPEGETRRRTEREQDRDVRIRAVQDGMAVFDGLLPAAGAQAVAMRLREMSLQVCDDDPRTMAQRRADALIALADGSGRLSCGCGKGLDCPKADVPATPRRPLIQVGVSAETLLGLRDDPAFLSGYGPVDAALARTLAEHARFQVIPEYFPDESTTREARTSATPPTASAPDPDAPARTVDPARTRRAATAAEAPWERALTARERTAAAAHDAEPTPGVDRGRLISAPGPAEPAAKSAKIVAVRPFSNAPAREVRAVDGSCRFPGCTMPAAETALVQFDPSPGRPVLPPNAAYRAVLCTHHHRLKSLADKGKHPWRVYLADNDRMRWIDPSGEPHETVREGARYLFPHTDIDAPPRPTSPLRVVPDFTESPTAGHPFTADLAYPMETHTLIHPQLSRTTPDNDIPDRAATH
ncbi:DUF222 domain-containing protein [Nocardia seriolae]|uniref:DUF222 domain-containing protein n=1 Tax=Nocardia seriolae TaxID=37332 RepID=UPI0009DDD744|nr:DUF222 domain-containing protein [Nocardia seriolae]MTJ61700.1 DUF222 domain-containing protein [Nocardia seriolae]MTJ75231.1 DUF222 domain-containing protein [Nocardia seriolae]MTJ86710.1 DUF222 domain-containing protein [Nocardia seriolae]MTK30706.1 DUF222 domain-containing protein [Nocardia seriolae]MTK39667.1 DUF222 domain-containing protein [Nocardia seriolae]